MGTNLRTFSFTCVAAAVALAGCATNGPGSALTAPAALRQVEKIALGPNALPPSHVYIVSNGSNVVDEYRSGGKEITTFAPPSMVGWANPNAATYDSKNHLLYVNGGYQNPISEFTPDGTYKGDFADPGGDTDGIVYDATDDALFIATSVGSSTGVFKVSSSGKVEAGPTGQEAFGATYDSRGKIVFTVINSGKAGTAVAAYDSNLNLLKSFSFKGLSHNGMILWDPVTKLLYVGHDDGKIYAYSIHTKPLTLAPVKLSGSFSSLENPMVMTCDTAGNIYVTDSGTQNAQVFDANGNYLASIGSDIDIPWGIVDLPKH
jgi:hypothetical protein